MIVDMLENILFYEKMIPSVKNGMEVVKSLKTLEAGSRYEFEGGYLMVQKGETKPFSEGTFEAHRKYVDVQIVMEGAEEMAWKPVSELTSVIPYDEVKDAERFEGTKEHNMLITDGMFYIAFPEDGHKPVSHSMDKHTFTKIVMKLKI